MNSSITLIFSKAPGFFSWLVRLLTGGRWSHVAIVMPDDPMRVIDSRLDIGVAPPRLREPAMLAWPARAVYEIPCEQLGAAAAAAFLRSQVGSDYDGRALWWWMLPWRRWDAPHRWFCFEFATAAVTVALGPEFKPVDPSHASGRELEDICIHFGKRID